MELIGLYLIAAGLLVVAGVAKAVHPDDTARAVTAMLPVRMRSVPVRTFRWAVRTLAMIEVVVGLSALARPGELTATLVALSYALFAGVVAYARLRGGPLATCGCFGRPDTPATWLHVALNLVLVVAALGVALARAGADGHSVASVLARQPWSGVPLLFASAVGLWLTVLALSTLPVLEGARRRVQPARAGAVGRP